MKKYVHIDSQNVYVLYQFLRIVGIVDNTKYLQILSLILYLSKY